MRYVFLLLLLSQVISVFGQNEKVQREPFELVLVYDSLKYYEQNVEQTAYFAKDRLLQIYPSEKVFIEVEFNGEFILTMKTVKENLNPVKTIELQFDQTVESKSSHYMMLKINNPFDYKLLFDAFIYRVDGRDWEKTSILPVQPQNGSFEIWNDVIVSIALDNWRLVQGELKEKPKKRENIANEEKKRNTELWIKSKGIKINQLPRSAPNELNYTCDSILFLKQVKNDTTVIWANGWQSPLDTSEILDFIATDWYGKTSYIREVYKTGKVNGVKLMPYTFLTRNDSLFELESFSKLTSDSLRFLFNAMISDFDNKSKYDSIQSIFNDNSYKEFKLIYHPDIFVNRQYRGNINNDIISIEKVWLCNGNRYFELEIVDSESPEVPQYYVFSEEYKWLKYDGCDIEGIECLIPENIVEFEH